MILDAGAFLELLFRSDAGLRVEAALVDADAAFAPELLDAEVLHRLLRMRHVGQLTAGEVEVAVADLRDAPIQRISHVGLLGAATRMGAALSGYDALYAAAADLLGRTLWTTDRRLARTCRDQFDLDCTVVATSGR